MKKFLLVLLSLIFSNFFYSQQNKKNLANDRVSVVSSNRDTLWLINNDLGKLIANTWDHPKSSKEKKPRIIMVDVLPDNPLYIETERKKNKKRFKG